MSTIKIGALTLEMGKGYRIITEDELRRRVPKLLSDGKSKYLEMVRRFGGKKLKVYGYNASENRVWMSADHSDSYKWKPLFLVDYVESRHKIENSGEEGMSESVRAEAQASISRPAPSRPAARGITTPKRKDTSKLLKMMLLMSLMNQANKPAEPAPKKSGKTAAEKPATTTTE
jgi:hypothetical protein